MWVLFVLEPTERIDFTSKLAKFAPKKKILWRIDSLSPNLHVFREPWNPFDFCSFQRYLHQSEYIFHMRVEKNPFRNGHIPNLFFENLNVRMRDIGAFRSWKVGILRTDCWYLKVMVLLWKKRSWKPAIRQILSFSKKF